MKNLVNIGNGNKIKNSNICSGQLILGEEIMVNGKKIPKPPGNRQDISIINDKIFANGYEYQNGEWKKTFLAKLHKYF